jgi:mannose-6-phosphate isomerase-like protein (cupin superfamily)
MAQRGDELENPVTGERAVVRKGSDDTNGEYLLADLFVRPGGRVALPHVHPALTETFEVLHGRLDVVVDGRHSIAEPGQRITVPPGTVHDWWNAGDTEAHVLAEVRGRGVERFESMLATLWGLGRDGKTNAKGVPGPLQMAVTMSEFADTMRVTKPPFVVQRIVFGLLAPVGRAVGYRATYEKYQLAGARSPSDNDS